MAQLIVRNLDPSLVDALKERAGRHGRSAEAEHREILAAALSRSGDEIKQVLLDMPEVDDSIFDRIRQYPEDVDL